MQLLTLTAELKMFLSWSMFYRWHGIPTLEITIGLQWPAMQGCCASSVYETWVHIMLLQDVPQCSVVGIWSQVND